MTESTDERRGPPRVNLLRVESSGLPLSSNNISTSGIQLSCPSLIFELLASDVRTGVLNLQITLPDEQKFAASCRVVYANDYGDEALIGLAFETFEGDGAERLGEYIKGWAH